MPLIEVWNSVQVSAEASDLWRRMLRTDLQEACLTIPELKLTNRLQVTVRYPDLADDPSEPGDAVVVIVRLLFDLPERTQEVHQRLAKDLSAAVRKYDGISKNRNIEVAIEPFDQKTQVFYVDLCP